MNVCLIGGGDRKPIISEIVRDLESPKVLIIPSACSTEQSYNRKLASCLRLFDGLGLPSVVLHSFEETPTLTEKDEKFGDSSALYVIGGHSPTLMGNLARHGTADYVNTAIAGGKLYMGSSAGALVPFAGGLINPSKRPEMELWDYEIIKMLGLIPTIATAHANMRDPRRKLTRLEHLERRLPRDIRVGFGIDNGATLAIMNGISRTIRSNPAGNVHAVERYDGKVSSRKVTHNEELTRLVQNL